MASGSTCQTERVDEEKKSSEPQNSNSSKSGFQPTVCLKDWWLIRAEKDSQGRTLAVSGLTSREGQALRGFTSAPILKIYDVFNIETIDGICIVLKGFINKTRSQENGFPSEVIEQFLFGFPPQWETFNEICLGRESKGKASANYALGLEKPSLSSEEVKDPKKLDQKDHVGTTGETMQDDDGRKGSEIEDNLMRDNQNDGEVASEVIVQKKAKRATRSSDKLNSTNTSASSAKGQTIQDHNGRKDYEVEENLMSGNQNDGEVASEFVAQKKTKRAMRSSDHLTSTSIAKEQTIQDHNGRKDYEVEDNLMRGNQKDGEVASEVILPKKAKRATRSSDKLNSTNTSISIAKEQKMQDHNGTKDYEVEENLMSGNQNDGEVASEFVAQKKTKRATRSSDHLTSTSIAKEQTIQDHNGSKDYEVEDNLMRGNRKDGEVASEVILQKKAKRATRSSDKLNSTNTSISIAKEQTIHDHNGRKDYEVEENLMSGNQNDGEVTSEVTVEKKTKRATRSSDNLNSTNTSTSIVKEHTIQDRNGRKDYEIEDNLTRDNQNDGEVASEVLLQKKTKRATRSLEKLNSTNTSTSIAKEHTIQDYNRREDYEVEDNLMRDNQNDGEVASEVTVQKMRRKAMRSSDKLNSTHTSTSIAKEQIADVNRTAHSKSSSASMKNAKRKLSYGSPQQGKEAVQLISPEPLSFNRSRSGRVLLPPMAFWRNERAVYDADQTVTGIKQGDPNLDILSKVCRSEPSKKRRQCR